MSKATLARAAITFEAMQGPGGDPRVDAAPTALQSRRKVYP